MQCAGEPGESRTRDLRAVKATQLHRPKATKDSKKERRKRDALVVTRHRVIEDTFCFPRVQQAEGGEELVLRRAAESEGRELQAGHEVRHAERGEEHGRDEEPRPAAGGTGTGTHTHTEFVCVHCIMHMVRIYSDKDNKNHFQIK